MSIESNTSKTPWAIIALLCVIVIAGVAVYFYQNSAQEIASAPIEETKLQPEIMPENTQIEPEQVQEELSESINIGSENETELFDADNVVETPPKPSLPTLGESDSWFDGKLADLTWRRELLNLIITDDMIRRFVVFTDNFNRGTLAYEHLPLVSPKVKFSALEVKTEQGQVEWQWDEKNTQRFKKYVDLLRSVDKATLVQWYVELKPLIDQAYQELGYEDEDFTEVLQSAISKVLDMDIVKKQPKLIRPSVMYKYQDPSLESLDDAEKLLLRLGKENLLVIKSILLEVNEKLNRVR